MTDKPVPKFAEGDRIRLTRQGVTITVSSIVRRSDEPRYYGSTIGGAAFGAYESECVLAEPTP